MTPLSTSSTVPVAVHRPDVPDGRRPQPGSPTARTTLLSGGVAIGCTIIALGIMVGTVLLDRPVLAPVAAAAVLGLPLLLLRPVWLLVVVTVVEVGNLSGVAALNGAPGLETVLLGLTLVAVFLAWIRGRLRLGWSPFLTAGLLYLLVLCLSTLVGLAPENSVTATAETAKALLWPVVVLLLMLAPGRAPQAVARAFALTLAVLSALTLFQEFVVGNSTTFGGLANVPLAADIGGVTARHAGPQDDANFWGRVLVLGLPLALSLAMMAGSRLRAALWLCAALSIAGGIVLTGSRGTLLAAFAVVCLWALLTGGRVAKLLVLAPLIAGLVLIVPGVGSRLMTLSTIGTDDGLAVTDPSLEGRVAAQRVGAEMVVDHPVLGVGPGNFLTAAPDYLRELALDSQPLAPHNQYLEAAAEGGLLGLLAWVLLIGTAAFVAFRARLLARKGGVAVAAVAPPALSNAILAALAGWALASIFLHLATFRTFLLVAAVGAALDLRARRRVAELGADDLRRVTAPTGHRRSGVRPASVLLLGLLVLSAALWGTGDRSTAPSWSATTSTQLVVRYESDTPAYDQATLSRPGLVRTLVGIAANDRFAQEGLQRVEAYGVPTDGVTVHVTGSVQSANISITATGPDSRVAELVALETRRAASAFVDGVSPLYGTRDGPGDPVVKQSTQGSSARLALIPLGLAVAVAVSIAARRLIGARRPGHRPRHSAPLER